jgi:arylsulfatase A-like enzyme
MCRVFLLLTLLLTAPIAHAARPNIIFILTDDLDTENGNWLSHYPAFKASMADVGTTFVNHFVSNAVCCPSRSTILRGQYSDNTGVFTNTPPNGSFIAFRDRGLERSTIATWLQGAGYRTVFLGKYLNGYPERTGYVPPGWDEWYGVGHGAYPQFDYDMVMNGRVVHRGNAPSDYLQDVLRGLAVDFIRRTPGPFFMYLAGVTPHGPAVCAPRHSGAFQGVKAPRTPTFNEPDVSHQPAWLRAQMLIPPGSITGIDATYRRRLQSMLAVVETVDAVIATLQQTGQLDNTYIVFTSDNGFHLGQHRLRGGKDTGFEEDIRVPLIVRGPGVPKGVVVKKMTVNIDFAPTFAELAGATAPAFIDGRSLVPFLEGETPAEWRSAFLLSHRKEATPALNFDAAADAPEAPYVQNKQPDYDGIRTERYTYMRMIGGQRALYDLATDPVQHRNVWGVAPLTLREHLNSRLNRLLACSGESCRSVDR